MSMDRSLKGKNALERHRNVLTRAERIERLKELGRWTDESTAMGLPKVVHRKAAVGKKDKVATEEPGTEATETTDADAKKDVKKDEKTS